MGKSNIEIIFFLIVIFLIFIISSCNLEPNPPEPIPPNGNLSINYKEQAIFLAEQFRQLPMINKIEINNDQDIENMMFVGIVTREIFFNNEKIKFPIKILGEGYKFISIKEDLDELIPTYNNLLTYSESINKNSTDSQFVEFISLCGEFGGKTTYILIKKDSSLLFQFINNGLDFIKTKDLDSESICGANTQCSTAYDSIKNEVSPQLSYIFDEGFFILTGKMGEKVAPIIFTDLIFSEELIKNEIIPRAENLSKQFLEKLN